MNIWYAFITKWTGQGECEENVKLQKYENFEFTFKIFVMEKSEVCVGEIIFLAAYFFFFFAFEKAAPC